MVVCEVCHERWNPADYKKVLEEYDELIYRPGQDEATQEELTSDEWIERQAEIEQAFANPAYHADKGGDE